MEMLGCTTDRTKLIIAVDAVDVANILNACVQEAGRLDRFGHRRNDADMIDQAAAVLATGNQLDDFWVSGWHK